MKRFLTISMTVCVIISLMAVIVHAWTPLVVKDDHHVRMPGSQPPSEESFTVEGPNRCLNCHADYDSAVEPGFNWKGSMMAQASRDFLFFACLTVSAQDSIWAKGNPNATDICLRCHFPKGWVEGRSDPTNGSLMTAADWDGVHCDFCHLQMDPFFEDTYQGVRESNQWETYWDETASSSTPSQAAADETLTADRGETANFKHFNGSPFFDGNNKPYSPDYNENGGGQYFLTTSADKRASFADANPRHGFKYSRFHKSRYFCSTCHDVSNPIFANLQAYAEQPLPSETNSAYKYYHVERTFSEFMLSAYGQQDGAPGIGPFAPEQFNTSKQENSITMCQDCHMRDVVGVGSNKAGSPLRTGDPLTSDSIEHPYSGQPLHDMTGGNAWVSYVLASSVTGSPNYDATNNVLLNQGPQALTLDISAGEAIDPSALLAGVDRTKQQLLLAASIDNLSYDSQNRAISFRIQNQTGHKLISGFPEGRRMFINVKVYSESGDIIYEINPYDADAGTLKGLEGYSYSDPNGLLPPPDPLISSEYHMDEVVYEMKPSSSLTGEDKTFHFALATDRYKDNRIPPKGFQIDEALSRLCQPRWEGNDAPGYYTTSEYEGGYDNVELNIPAEITDEVDAIEVNLYYQTTSREYIEFLRNEINGTGSLTLSSPTPSGESNAYIAQTDQTDTFFPPLKAWGDTIWNLWTHNKDLPGAAPFLMAQATIIIPPSPCNPPVPTLNTPIADTEQVTLTWSDESSDEDVIGYRLYYDQAGKSQLVSDINNPSTTSYVDAGLLGGIPHCYKVTSYTSECESAFSNIQCATPFISGDLNRDMEVDLLDAVTGLMVTADQEPNEEIYSGADINQDGKIGLQEVIYILQRVSELR